MNHRNVPVILVAASFLAAAQSSPPPLSRPGPQAEALRLVAEGQFPKARQSVAGLIEHAERTGSPAGYQAGLWHLLGVTENRLGRYDEAEAALSRGVQLCNHSKGTDPELTIALLVELADANLKPFNNGLANFEIRALALAPGDPKTLFAGTPGGVFKIIDDAGAF